MKYFLFVGTDHNLAQYEIPASLPEAVLVLPGLYSFDATSNEVAISLVSRLGSSIKLTATVEDWMGDINQILPYIETSNFSVSLVPQDAVASLELCNQIKDRLGKKYRFVMPKNKFGLFPVVIRKQKVNELLVYNGQLLRTIWTHDISHWIKKDRMLPFANARAGLLPPKIARMLINMSGITDGENKTLLDPFCGSGRILLEALELGFVMVGSDVSDSQVRESQSNLDFANADRSKYSLFVSDASQLSKHLPLSSVDLIVTEPYMGKPNTRTDRIPDMVKGLKKLYLGALKSWVPLLKDHGIVVMVLPQIVDRGKTYITSSVVDDPHLIGYNVSLRDVIYSRPDATVRREIVILKKNYQVK